MRRIFTMLAFGLFASPFSMAQEDCDGTRYRTYDLFSGVDVTTGITYGANTAVSGGNQVLRLDVYRPQGDTRTDRPVIVVAFGGSFIGGQRSDVAFLCNIFARMGYVAVAPDYRVGLFFPNQVTTTLAVMRAMHDIKAAVRFMKKTAVEGGNPYGIDCGRIVVGGISAGAIGSIHAAYMDQLSEIPAYMANDTAGLGGVEGNSGTPNYPSDPLGVLNFSGAIGDSTWITPGSVPLVSVHEENDGVVPYYTTEVSVSNIPTGLTASGSGDMHIRAQNVGVEHSLKTYFGVNAHVGYLSPIDTEALDFVTEFLADLVCGGSSNSCNAAGVGIAESRAPRMLEVYPNPTVNDLRFIAPSQGVVEVIDMTGRMLVSRAVTSGQQQLDVSSLPQGTFILRFIGQHVHTARIVKQ